MKPTMYNHFQVLAVLLLSLWCSAVKCQLTTSPGWTPDDIVTPAKPKCGLFPGAEVVKKVETLQSFPGFGWDNLRNLQMAAVFDMFKYDKCRLTPDRLHVVPDFVDVITVKESTYDRFAQYYQDMNEYFEANKQSINIGAGFGIDGVGISGSYGKSYQDTKRTMYTSSTSVLKTSFTVHSYTLIAEPDSALSDDFKARIMQIGDMLRLNKTNMAQYLSEILVRDFGTNVITRIDAGAHITQEDYVDKSSILREQSSLDAFKAASTANFLKYFHFNFDDSHSSSQKTKDALTNYTRHSKLKSVGGLDLLSISDANKWFNISISDLVALDRNGDPIYWYISDLQVPELPTMMTIRISQLVENAVKKYYDKNTVKGCTNSTASNYKYLANKDDGTCEQSYDNLTFGGMYQTCTISPDSRGPQKQQCSNFIINNGITGGLYCPTYYTEELIVNGTSPGYTQPYTHCATEYYTCWQHLWMWKCSKWACHTSHWKPNIKYAIYWCSATAQIKGNSGFLYGGSYQKGTMNPFTGQESCPGTFFSQEYGVKSQFTMCLSRDYEDDTPYSVPFAGFMVGKNVNNKPCAKGYSQHLLVDHHDQDNIYVCIRTGVAMKKAAYARIRSPPFMRIPDDYQANMALHGYDDGRLWVYNETTKVWIHGQDQSLTPQAALNAYISNINHTVDEL